MPIALRVEPELDERKAEEEARKAEQVFGNAGLRAAQEFSAGMVRGMGDSNLSAHIANIAEGLGEKVSVGAALAVTGLAGIGVAAVEVGHQLFEVGERFDEISDKIAGATGETGARLEELNQAVLNVADTTASSFEKIGQVVAGVSQQFGLAGEPLEDLTKHIADLDRITGEKTNIEQLGEAMRGFGADLEDPIRGLNELYEVHNKTGESVSQLTSVMIQLGPAARTLGLSFDDTAGLIEKFHEAGVNASSTAQALSHAAGVFAKSGVDMTTGLQDTITEIQNFIKAGDDAAARNLARDVFGERGADKMLDLIRQNKLSADDLHSSLGNVGDKISEVADKTKSLGDNWEIVVNKVTHFAEILGGPIYDYMNGIVGAFADILTNNQGPPHYPYGSRTAVGPAPGTSPDPTSLLLGPPPGAAPPGQPGQPPSLGDILNNPDLLGPDTGARTPQDIAAAIAKNKTGAGRVVLPLGTPPAQQPGESDQQYQAELRVWEQQHSLAEKKAQLTKVQQDQNHTDEDLVKAQNDVTKADLALEEAKRAVVKAGQQRVSEAQAQVPYPAGYGGAPRPGETAEQYSKEQAVLEAAHKRQEAEARLQQLQQDSSSSPEKLTEATNNLARARKDEYEAMARLNEQTHKANDQLDQLGAKIDADFGISKGLPGIAENLVKFLANLVAAPVYGALEGVSAARGGPTNGASGLIGMAALSGAFGPQYVPDQGSSAPTSTAPAATTATTTSAASTTTAAGYPGDAALLARIPAGHYSQHPGQDDLTQGLGDCSSAVEDLVHILSGEPTAGRQMNTATEAMWLKQHGFIEGMGSPGDFQVGFSEGHTAATLPGGTRFSWGSESAAQARGIGGGPGTGADDPSFTQHFYRPAGAFPGGPGATATASASSLSSATISVGTATINVGGTGAAPNAANPASPAAPGSSPGSPANPPLNPATPSGLSTPYSPALVPTGGWEGLMQREAGSSGGWAANTGNGFFGGLQFTQSSWDASKPPGAPARADLATPAQQIEAGKKLLSMQGPGAWPHTFYGQTGGAPGGTDTVPAMLTPGEHVLTTQDVNAMGGQQGVYAFRDSLHQAPPSTGAIPGTPASVSGPPLGPTKIGGLAPPAGQGSGFGITGGGLIGLAESAVMQAASSAIEAGIASASGAQFGGAVMGFDGGGPVDPALAGGPGPAGSSSGGAGGSALSAAVNIGIQELNRAIGYAGQAAGIGVSGLMETFLPTGGSELANNNWFTRILGGIVGARPALPNIAGQQTKSQQLTQAQQTALQAPPARAEHYGAGAPAGPPGDVNNGVQIEHFHNYGTADQASQDLNRHQMAANDPIGYR